MLGSLAALLALEYSPLNEVNRANVARLVVAWTFRTGDMYDPHGKGGRRTAFECTPLFLDGTLYVSTPLGRVIALDPDRGTPRWYFDPHVDRTAGYGDFANRGVAVWADPETHRRRLFLATIDARLLAINAVTGEAIQSSGSGGVVDLRAGLRNPPRWKWEYEETSPPAVVGGVVVVGSAVADNQRADAASGEVRAFDARSGKLRWTFDPMPHQKTGAANAWSVISADPERDLVFIPTGSASPDYYGGERPGDDRYADSVVALHASTGELVWSFQTVHHDLWDYDVASQPTLFPLRRAGGAEIPAIAIGSKTGNLFILDRRDGKPVFGIEERPVPASDVPGERASTTQPFPVLPEPLVPQGITPADAWGTTEKDRAWCAAQIARRGAELDVLLEFMAYQWVRVPRFRPFAFQVMERVTKEKLGEQLRSEETWLATLKETNTDPATPGADYEGMKRFFDSGEWNIMVETDWYMQRAFRDADGVLDCLRKRYWGVSFTQNGRLIASDNPVVLEGDKGQMIGFKNAKPIHNFNYFASMNTMMMLNADDQVFSHVPDFSWLDEHRKHQTDWTLFSKEKY